jgi:hypothetical protein
VAKHRHSRRGVISEFSYQSARTLTRKLNAIDQRTVAANRVGFLTLTYPFFFVAPHAAKVHLKAFLRKMQREIGRVPLFWKMEPQQRGAPHFHLMLFAHNPEQLRQLAAWSAHAWHQIAGHDDPRHLAWHLGELGNKPCLEPIRTWNGAKSYSAKYLGKVVAGQNSDEWEHPGRWWGVRFYEDLPVKILRRDLTQAKAKLAKRLFRRWYEKQESGRYVVVDSSRGKVERLYLRPAAADRLRTMGLKVHPLRRRWANNRGGMTIYAPDTLAKQVMKFIGEAVVVFDDDPPI